MNTSNNALSEESLLWRYVGFTKFVSLLVDGGLYFTRADQLSDPFEGAKGIVENEAYYDRFYREFARNAIMTAPGRAASPLTAQQLERQTADLLANIRRSGQRDRERTYLNCWHEAEHESEAMWRLYAGWKFTEGGLAIGTRVSRLRASLPADEVRIGRITYVDFGKAIVGPNEAIWNKDISFQHEREVRAVLFRSGRDPRPTGYALAVDLGVLIDEVRLSPGAPVWFENLVKGVIQRFGFGFAVRRSFLERTPFY